MLSHSNDCAHMDNFNYSLISDCFDIDLFGALRHIRARESDSVVVNRFLRSEYAMHVKV
jgi:hypothetical protein